MTTLPYNAIRVLDVESDPPRVLVRLELTYAELSALQQAVYPGTHQFSKTEAINQAWQVSDNLLRICRDLSLEDQEAYKVLAPGYRQESLW